MTKKLPLALFILFLSPMTSAMVFEVDGDFGYDKTIYGSARENSIVTRSYSGGLSSYIFSTTALDLGYTYSNEITSNNDRYTITGYTVDHMADQTRVLTKVYQVGLKQVLASKNSFLVPMISIGYARQVIRSESDATYLNTTSGGSFYYRPATSKYSVNSVFATFMLQFHLTEQLSLKASIKSIFPAFDYNKAKDNLKYAAGFSWMF